MEVREKKYKLLICKSLIFAIIVYPLLFLWQGLDFTDSGFHMTNYSLIFSNPESIQYSFMYWLTNVIGGSWLMLFGKLGYIGIRFFGVIIIWITIYIIYILLKEYINKFYLLSGLFLTLIFTYNSTRIMEYNRLTAMFYSIAILFLFAGMRKSKNYLVFLSGIVLGVNVFIRVANIVGFAFFVAILFYGFINKEHIKKQIYQLMSFVVGFVGGIGATLVLMKLLGHYEYFINTMRLTSEISKYSSASHNMKYLLKLLFKDHIEVLKLSGIVIVIIIFILIIGKLTENLRFDIYKLKYFAFVLLIPCICYFIYNYDKDMIYYNVYAIKMFVGLMYFISAAYIINLIKSNNEFRLITFFGLIMMFVTPLGSDNGIYNVIFGMWIIGVILFSSIANFTAIKIIKADVLIDKKHVVLQIFMKNIRIFAQLVLVIFIVFSFTQGYRETFRDSYNRLEMRYPVNSEVLKGIYTTKERSILVNDLLAATKQYVSKEDYLLAYSNIPMIHYLTGTKPYLDNAWPELYIYQQFKAAFTKAQSQNPNLPIIIISKLNTSTTKWPKDHSSEFKETYLYNSLFYLDINDFIEAKNYAKVWENEYFEIFKARL